MAATIVLGVVEPAVCARARAAESFPEVTFESPRSGRHLAAYASLIAGAGLIVGSFSFHDRANDAYDEYLVASDGAEIQRLFDRAERFDRLSTGSLLAGEALFATGLYLRFLRRPSPSRFSISAGVDHCRVAYRF